MKQPYQPISCNFYDLLLDAATRKQVVPLVLYSPTMEGTISLEATILDVFTRKGEEFMTLGNGEEVRLDRIVSVNGIALEGFCPL